MEFAFWCGMLLRGIDSDTASVKVAVVAAATFRTAQGFASGALVALPTLWAVFWWVKGPRQRRGGLCRCKHQFSFTLRP